MVIVKFGIIVLLGIVMVPYWNFANISAFTDFLPFLRDVFLTLPFTLFSILFVQILSPMNIAYRRLEKTSVSQLTARYGQTGWRILFWPLLFCSLPSRLRSR